MAQYAEADEPASLGSSKSPDDKSVVASEGLSSKDMDAQDMAVIHRLLKSQGAGSDRGPKQVPLVFKNLTVQGPRSDEVSVKTLPRAILNTFGIDQFNFLKRLTCFDDPFKASSHNSRRILSDFTGIVKPGEMLFVLGRPGSGCSTFLRTAANRSSLKVTGDLTFANVSAKDFGKTSQRETIYLPEEDRHIACLTVRQTIQFALRMNLPQSIRSRREVHELVDIFGKMFGIQHVLDTPVGGAFFPGVSGGERKRVSIAEVLAAGSSVQSFDNSTRGLDSSTALDFVKALRNLTDIGHKTTLATLYQAAENIYDHFDKVLLIDQGCEAFFGRTEDAKPYFEGLGFIHIPGQTTAEFLTSITDPSERRTRPGSVAENIKTPTDLADAFKQSPSYAKLQGEIAETELSQAAAAALTLIPSSAYNLPYLKQIWECLYREYQIFQGQMIIYKTKCVNTIILCLMIGSMYYGLTTSSQGAFARGGIIFFALIVNGWLQFPELFDAHTNRPVLERQAALNMYRPSAVTLARFLIDLPLIAFQHVLFMLPFYFLSGLQVHAGKFFFFYLTLFISTVCFSNLLRMFAYYVPSLDDCFRYGGTACTFLCLFAGFLIPAQNMRPYFGWIHWINPMYYAYENLLTNEFQGLTISCVGALIPDIAGANLNYQSCTVRGAVPGHISVDGLAYTESSGYYFSHRWRNIGIMISIGAAYVIFGALGSEVMRFTSQGGNPIAFAKRSKTSNSIDDAVDVEKKAAIDLSEKSSGRLSIEKSNFSGPALTWKNLEVDIGEKHILQGISAYVRPGDFIALCGASGAGKTTLLTALSQTNFTGRLKGDLEFGCNPLGNEFKKLAGFAQQMDLHDGTATIREALEFSALLRQPKIYSQTEKLAYVDTVLDLLDLRKVEHALIGNDDAGLGVEITKRVTIGVELAARPKILFADEPTSGLDSQGAAHIVRYLKALAQRGQAIIVTIHQPSVSLFHSFDKLLALSSDGEQLYFGTVDAVIPYFARHGAICPPDTNPAEFVLETVGAGIHAHTGKKASDWAATWRNSPEAISIVDELRAIKESQPFMTEIVEDKSQEFNASIALQTRLLTLRMFYNQWRNVPYLYSKIWVHIISAIMVGFTLFQVGDSPSDLQNRAFSVFFLLFLANAIVNTILARFFFARLYWEVREGPARAYSWVALCNASILAEMPGALICGVLYYCLWYFPSGLPDGGTAGYIFLFTITYEVFQVLLGLFMMAISPDLGVAGNLLVFIICSANWFNGIIVPYSEIQAFWRYWLYYLSPFTYLMGGMVTAVIGTQQVKCSSADLTTFPPPPGQTCGQYAGSWAASANAQLLNPNETRICEVCKWTTGDQYLEGFNLGAHKWGGIWAYWGIFLLFTASNMCLVYFFTWATRIKRWKLFYFF